MSDVLGRSFVGFRWEFDISIPWGVVYLSSKLKLSFLYLIKLIKLIKNSCSEQTFGTESPQSRGILLGRPPGDGDGGGGA